MLSNVIHSMRSRWYRATFQTEMGRRVLGDLARFCHAYTTTHVQGDPVGSAQLEGRRQVFLRIRGHLRADQETIEDIAERTQALERDRSA